MTAQRDKPTSAQRGNAWISAADPRANESLGGSGTVDRQVDTATNRAAATKAQNTNKAYAADWKHFARWCRMKGTNPLPPRPQTIGLYLTDLATPARPQTAQRPLSASTIQRRLSGLSWNYAQRGFTLDRTAPHIADAIAGIKRDHARPPVQKEAILRRDILAMVASLPYDLRGLRDRAILLLGYAGGLGRSEIVGLDLHKSDAPDSTGRIEVMDSEDFSGALLTLNTRTGPRQIKVSRAPRDHACAVHALEQWLHFGRIGFGPIFLRCSRDGSRALETRLSDKHVARLIKQTVLDAGVRSDLPENERLALFSGQSLRVGAGTSVKMDRSSKRKNTVRILGQG